MLAARSLTRRSFLWSWSRPFRFPPICVPRRAVASASPRGPAPPIRKSSIGCSPRQFPTGGFEVIDPSLLVEEEKLPTYGRSKYYPMRIGDIVGGHYQVVAKLGYGSTSTVWLARDLNKERLYRALKVHICSAAYQHELSVYEHLKKPVRQEIDDEDSHPGRDHVRQLEDFFLLDGPHGRHAVFVMVPLGMSLATMQTRQRTGVFPPILVTQAISQALLGLALLHSADVVHTDLHADNLLIALTDESVLSTIEESEMAKPSPRKQVGDTTIHVSHYVLGGAGALTIGDLGQARIGRVHTGRAMPIPYRAPEVILDMPWGTPVDMWSAGLLVWTLLEPKRLFPASDTDSSPELRDAHQLAAMTATLGPPPKEFRDRSKKCAKYWDEQGSWQGPVPLPPTTRLADLVTTLEGEQKALFVDFLECCLAWLPEERLTADQTYFHSWLRGYDENGGEGS
ncbi:hypothetical protein VTK73DRAFT_9214 [Phialemonium thermophilum]|uniref:non-specific serine/threonine protein kinase n=1 Tax=Phialemonium thermophilum TaxID=223376 RepID=A0ABR3W3N4_9PEZI